MPPTGTVTQKSSPAHRRGSRFDVDDAQFLADLDGTFGHEHRGLSHYGQRQTHGAECRNPFRHHCFVGHAQ
jgi:hypothetical protein